MFNVYSHDYVFSLKLSVAFTYLFFGLSRIYTESTVLSYILFLLTPFSKFGKNFPKGALVTSLTEELPFKHPAVPLYTGSEVGVEEQLITLFIVAPNNVTIPVDCNIVCNIVSTGSGNGDSARP